MKIFIPIIVLLCTSCSQRNHQKSTFETPKPPPMSETTSPKDAELMTNISRLTFEGRRAGEGYFSADGSKIVFQSERHDGNPFYQIYTMDLEFGDVEMISNGVGKTTCAWIHPDGEQILYASTHLDSDALKKQKAEIDFRNSGKERRYSWDYDEYFDLFVNKGEELTQLTTELGYDAEGSFSPDGKLIAFASNRNAYNGKGGMSEEEIKLFELDKSYMIDIFIMNSNGSDVKQLTTERGYDGGPFFSPDGKRIVWRKFTEDGMIAEIYSMNIDGTDKKQITHEGKMSWAPYYHPSQKYIIFTTNKNGFANFELYIVDAEGNHEPIRVSNLEGFDGLPVFTPEGNELYWTRKKDNNNLSQIYRADWNHQVALQALGLQ